MKKFLTKIIGASLAIAMMIGVGVGASNSKEAKPVHATESPVNYGPATFSTALPTDGFWTGVGGGSYCGGYGKNKSNAWSVTLDFSTATGIDWSTVDFDNTVSLNTSVKAAGNGASGNVVLSIDNTANQSNTHSITSNFGSGTNASSAKAVAMNIDSVSSSFDNITINFPSKSFITEFSCSLTFTEIPAVIINPESISLNETELLLGVGGQSTLTATVTPDGATGTVTWSSNNEAVATVDAGVVTAVAAGNATITARVSETIYATCAVTVTNNSIPATSVTLNENAGTLIKGQTKTLTATVLPANTTDNAVWSSNNEAVATVEDGVITAVAAGQATITATAGDVHADFALTVNPLNAANNYANAQVDIVGKIVAVGGKNAMIDDGTGGLWAYTPSSNISFSVGATVRVTGTTIVYNSGLEVSPATIVAASGEITTCTAEPISEQEVADKIAYHSQHNDYIIPHRKVSLTTGTVAASGNYLIFPYGDSTIEIIFSNCGMVAGKSYNIEGYLTSFYNSYLCMCVSSAQEVVVEPTGVTLNKTETVVGIDKTSTLAATVAPAGASQIVEWSSADENIATVSDAGVVTGQAIGVTTITATAGSCAATCRVIVSSQTKAEYSLVGLSNSNNGYANMYNVTFSDGQQWKIPGNQTLDGGLKIGGKFSTADKYFYSMSAYESVSEISVTHGAKDNQITVNSLKLYVFSSADDAAGNDMSKAVETVDGTYAPNDVVTFEPTAQGTKWENKFFRVVYNMTSSAPSSNCGLVLTKLSLKIDNPLDHLESALTIKTISGVESNGGATVENVALRFGGRILISDWNEINSKWPITDYGIMFARASMLTARSKSSLEEVFRNNPEDVAIVHKQTFTTPVANGNEYVFTAKLSLEESDYDTVFYAAPYIVAGGEYYFLQEEHESVRTLANDCYNNGGSSLSQTALATLKGNN